MADITDSRAVRLVNEQLRPICEAIRAIKARIVAMNTDLTDDVRSQIKQDTSELKDGRDAEGVSRLTGDDIFKALENLTNVANTADDVVIAKPCVRPLQAN